MLKLGVRAVKHSAAHRLAAHALLESLPAPPERVDNRNGIASWGMMLNDQLGCCTIAGLGHSAQVATLGAGAEVTVPDAVILSDYERFCGYVNGDPSTDQGGVELDVLADARAQGFGGEELLGYVSPDPANVDHVKKAIAWFRSVYVGAALPLSAQKQGGVWTVVAGQQGVAGGWGGHCMVAPAYTPELCPWITWGANQDADWGWFARYVEEVHVLLWKSQLAQFPAATQAQVLGMLEALQ